LIHTSSLRYWIKLTVESGVKKKRLEGGGVTIYILSLSLSLYSSPLYSRLRGGVIYGEVVVVVICFIKTKFKYNSLLINNTPN
jgi:hypothetical protein